jgi:hypothetical protein
MQLLDQKVLKVFDQIKQLPDQQKENLLLFADLTSQDFDWLCDRFETRANTNKNECSECFDESTVEYED